MAGSWAELAIGFDAGTERCEPCSGPPSSNRYWLPKIAIQFSMIVEITSCAPTDALSAPAIPAHTAPPSDGGEQREEDVQRLGHAGEVQADPQGADAGRRCTAPGRRC